MAANEPFKSTTYQVGRIPKAFSSDSDGNLIFEDIPNPEGVTLTELIEGRDSSNINFDSLGSFFTNIDNVNDALKYLNMFAYIKDTGRFLLVDSTITNEKVVEGEIYNDIKDAISWIELQTMNGYNVFNVLLMGSHKSQGALEQSGDLGVYTIDGSNGFSPIYLRRNGIKIIGVGNPVIRIKNFVGSSVLRKWAFQVDTDGSDNKINVSLENVSYEFVDCEYASMFWVKDAPINNTVKERQGLTVKNSTISFKGGSNIKNRLIDINNPTSVLPSQITIENIKIGSITGVTQSVEDIELFYLNHNDKSVLALKDVLFGLAEQPNPLENTDNAQITSTTAITVHKGNVIVDSLMLDEKFFWNGGIFPLVTTKLLRAYGTAKVSMSNVGIIRNSYNTLNENAGGITTIKDWIELETTTNVNIDGFDSYLNVDVVTISTSGIGSSGTSGTSGTPATTGSSGTVGDVKPVKGFYNKDKLAFGIGHLGEVRIGVLTNADLANIVTYTLTYGVPLWYNSDTNGFQFWNGTSIIDLGSGGGGTISKAKTVVISAPQFSPAAYSFPGEATFLGFEYTIAHNLLLSNKNAYSISVVDTVTGRKVEPQEVVALDVNNLKIIMASPVNITVTLIGF